MAGALVAVEHAVEIPTIQMRRPPPGGTAVNVSASRASARRLASVSGGW